MAVGPLEPAEKFSSLFRAVFAASPTAMLIFDDDATCLDANPAAADLVGIPTEQMAGRRLADFVAPDRRPLVHGKWEEFLRTGTADGDTRVATAEGPRAMHYCSTANVSPGRHLLMWAPPEDALNVTLAGSSDGDSPPLTTREREIVRRLAAGQTGAEIAEALVLSPDTVRTHVRNAMNKIGARTRAQLVVEALRSGAVSL